MLGPGAAQRDGELGGVEQRRTVAVGRGRPAAERGSVSASRERVEHLLLAPVNSSGSTRLTTTAARSTSVSVSQPVGQLDGLG